MEPWRKLSDHYFVEKNKSYKIQSASCPCVVQVFGDQTQDFKLREVLEKPKEVKYKDIQEQPRSFSRLSSSSAMSDNLDGRLCLSYWVDFDSLIIPGPAVGRRRSADLWLFSIMSNIKSTLIGRSSL